MTLFQRFKGLSLIKKVALLSLTAFILYTITGFLVLPPIIRITLEKKLPPLLNRSVAIKKVSLNPLTLSITIEDFKILKRNGADNFTGFKKLAIDLQMVSAFERALIIKSAVITSPEINFSRINKSTYSFSDLIPAKTETRNQQSPSKPFLFSINNIEIIDGNITFSDQPKETTHHITRLNLAIPQISNLPYNIESFIKPTFSAIINGTPFTINGDAKPFASSKQTDLNIDIKDLNIAKYIAYLPNPTKALLSSCFMDIKGKLEFISAHKKGDSTQLSYTGNIIFRDIIITDEQGKSFVELPRITITTAQSNLLDQKIKIKNLKIKSPRLITRRTRDLQILPLAFLLPSPSKPQNKPADTARKKRPIFQLTIDSLSLINGDLSFTDDSVDGFKTVISPFSFNAKNIDTSPNKTAEYKFSLTTETSENITSSGTIQLNPLAASGSININNVNLPKYMPYATAFLAPKIASGSLSLSTDYNFKGKGDNIDQNILLDKISINLANLTIKNQNRQILALPQLTIDGGSINPARKTAYLKGFSCKKPSFTIIRDKNNKLNIAALLKKQPPARESGATQNKPYDNDGIRWEFSLDSADISEYKINFIDQTLSPPALLSSNGIIKLSNFSLTGSTNTLDFTIHLNKSGTIKGHGKFGLSPLSLNLATSLDKLAFKPLQPYVNEHLNVLIKDGSLSSSGKISLTPDKKALSFHFNGTASIDNLAIDDSRSMTQPRSYANKLLSWDKIKFTDISFASTPLNLAVGDVKLDKPYIRISLSDAGKLNLSQLIKKTTANPNPPKVSPASTKKTATSSSQEIMLKKFSISEGKIDFIDNKISPAYSTSLTDFKGTIGGLSSNNGTTAAVNLSGEINRFSPIKISGSINPLAKDIFADLKIDLHDLDLSPTSPYTGKFLGYKTDKGKLTLNLHYLIKGKDIAAENHIFLDQFTLGDTVKSPDAVNLPINLALALLENRDGEIKLNIPVQGNLDDPEFSVGGVIAKVIVNLITKAITSPFALLGALIPDGDNLQFIPFEPGQTDISPANRNNLKEISTVLYERPGLKMDIIGKVDPQKDRNAIAEFRFQKLLKRQKAKDQQGFFSKKKLPDIADITIDEEEYPRYLLMTYEAMLDQKDNRSKAAKTWNRFTSFIKRDSPGKDLSNKEIKAQIIANLQIPDEELRLLALKRATNVKNYLIDSGKVEAERLFVIEPKIVLSKEDGSPGTDRKDTAMQVDLIIK